MDKRTKRRSIGVLMLFAGVGLLTGAPVARADDSGDSWCYDSCEYLQSRCQNHPGATCTIKPCITVLGIHKNYTYDCGYAT